MYIAIDLGGTYARIASSETLDSPSLDRIYKLPVTNNYQTDIAAISSAIAELKDGGELSGIGCGFPGSISEDKNLIVNAPNLSDWIGKHVASDLEKSFHCPVHLEHDSTIAALGEAIYGQGRGKDFVYVTWGTGFGATSVMQADGKVVARQFEAGHQIIDWQSDRLCGCGQTGCAEAYIGGANIEKYYKKQLSELTSEEWDSVCTHFANALLNVIVLNPTKLVVIGGGSAIKQKEKIAMVVEKIRSRLRFYPLPEIQLTQFGDNLGLVGALTLLRK